MQARPLTSRHCERSEAIQNRSAEGLWIASSQELLAMTAPVSSTRHPEVAAQAALEGRRPARSSFEARVPRAPQDDEIEIAPRN